MAVRKDKNILPGGIHFKIIGIMTKVAVKKGCHERSTAYRASWVTTLGIMDHPQDVPLNLRNYMLNLC